MSIPDFQTVMLPTLKLTRQEPIRVADAVEKISQEFNLNEEERSHLLPSGKQTTIANRVAWAITYLNKAGLLERVHRATYQITDAGKAVLARPISRIDIGFLKQFEKFEEFRASTVEAVSVENDQQSQSNKNSEIAATPEERIDLGDAELAATLKLEILDRVRSMSPQAFERLLLELMSSMGYGAEGSKTHIGKSGDGGIDGVITEDALGLDVIYLQAKRYAADNVIGVDKIREFVGALDEQGATKGVFVTTSRFASGARNVSPRSTKRITFMDGDELAKLMIKYNVGVRVYRTVEIKKIDADFFDDLEN